MEGWEGDEHWCVCLQFHCVDLACDTAGNGRVGGRWAWVCVLKIALCGSCLWHCTITFLYSLWRKSTFYLKGDPRWRVKLASKCRKCANISSYGLCMAILSIIMQQKCFFYIRHKLLRCVVHSLPSWEQKRLAHNVKTFTSATHASLVCIKDRLPDTVVPHKPALFMIS